MRNLSWLLIIGFISCYPAGAAQMTLSQLHDICAETDQGGKAACSFYIWGVTEGASLVATSERDSSGKFHETKNKQFCEPEGVKMSDMETLVKGMMAQDLVKFPEDMTMPAVSFVTAVVARKYPCVQ